MHAKTLPLACTFPWPLALQQGYILGEARWHVLAIDQRVTCPACTACACMLTHELQHVTGVLHDDVSDMCTCMYDMRLFVGADMLFSVPVLAR